MTAKQAASMYLGIIALGLAALVTAAHLTHRAEPGITWTGGIPAAAVFTVTSDNEIVIQHAELLGEYCTEVWLKKMKDGERMILKIDPEWGAFTAFSFGYVDGYCTVYLALVPALEGGQ